MKNTIWAQFKISEQINYSKHKRTTACSHSWFCTPSLYWPCDKKSIWMKIKIDGFNQLGWTSGQRKGILSQIAVKGAAGHTDGRTSGCAPALTFFFIFFWTPTFLHRTCVLCPAFCRFKVQSTCVWTPFYHFSITLSRHHWPLYSHKSLLKFLDF